MADALPKRAMLVVNALSRSGEVAFDDAYSFNPLVNAFALGLVRRDQIFFGKATGVGNPILYVGAKTGLDGIHGATMASAEFDE